LPSAKYNLVLIEEVGGPGDGPDVCWLLITALPIGTTEEIRQVTDDYLARWTVDIFWRTNRRGRATKRVGTGSYQALVHAQVRLHLYAARCKCLP
jgi:hypothetical protein